MKKSYIAIIISSAFLIGLFYLFGVLGFIKIYNISTSANEPKLKLHSKILVSNLKEFNNGDFVCYKVENKMFKSHIQVHRLVGIENDIIELQDGVLFLNGENFDKNLDLTHRYQITIEQHEKLRSENIVNDKIIFYKNENGVAIELVDSQARKFSLTDKIKMKLREFVDSEIKKTYNKEWNVDNFGPLKIPKGKCFMIGDNRHNSRDSRYIGLINKSDIVGTIFRK